MAADRHGLLGTSAFGVGVLALACLLAACRSPDPPIRVATVPWPPYDLIELAPESSRPDPDHVELIHLQTPSEVVRAFRYELVDAMTVTSHFALSAVTDLPETRIIYFIDVSLGGDALLARSGIDDAAELRGKRVGIEAAPLGSYTLTRALQSLDLQREDVEIVEIDTPYHYEAFRAGDVDALVTYDPTRARLIDQGANQLFGSDQIPYEIIDVLVTRADVIERRPDALAELVRAFDAGVRRFREDPGSAAERLAARHELTAESYLGTLDAVRLFDLRQNLDLFDDDDGPVRRGLLDQCEIMVEQGLLVSTPDLDPILDSTIALRALEQ